MTFPNGKCKTVSRLAGNTDREPGTANRDESSDRKMVGANQQRAAGFGARFRRQHAADSCGKHSGMEVRAIAGNSDSCASRKHSPNRRRPFRQQWPVRPVSRIARRDSDDLFRRHPRESSGNRRPPDTHLQGLSHGDGRQWRRSPSSGSGHRGPGKPRRPIRRGICDLRRPHRAGIERGWNSLPAHA